MCDPVAIEGSIIPILMPKRYIIFLCVSYKKEKALTHSSFITISFRTKYPNELYFETNVIDMSVIK